MAFASVRVTDEESILNLFETSSVPLQFIAVGGREGEGGGI